MARVPNGSGREVDSQHLQKLHNQQDEFVRLIQAKKEYIGDLQVQYQKENEGIVLENVPINGCLQRINFVMRCLVSVYATIFVSKLRLLC